MRNHSAKCGCPVCCGRRGELVRNEDSRIKSWNVDIGIESGIDEIALATGYSASEIVRQALRLYISAWRINQEVVK